MKRQSLVNDVAEAFASLPSEMFPCRLNVSFVDESAIDFGGVANEMFGGIVAHDAASARLQRRCGYVPLIRDLYSGILFFCVRNVQTDRRR